MGFCGFAGFFKGPGGVFMGLAGKLVSCQAALVVGGCGRRVGMRGEVMVFGGSVVRALGH